MFAEERRTVVRRMIVQGEEEIAVRLGLVRPQRNCMAEHRDGLVEPARFGQGVAQVAVGERIVGAQCDGPIEGGNRVVEPSRCAEGDAQVVVCLGQPRRRRTAR